MVELTIVVPVFNEQEVITFFYDRTRKVLDEFSQESELIFVDDGSTDLTAGILQKLVREDSRVRVITLSRNFGHQAAVQAGIDKSRGSAVVTIDCDLQDPPEVIFELVEQWRLGADVVHAVRDQRAGETKLKRFSASLFYRLMKKISDSPVVLDAGDFRLMSRRAIIAIQSLPERQRYIRGLITWVGFEQTVVHFQRDARFAGETKYPLGKQVKLAITAVTALSVVPLQISSALGVVLSTLSIAFIPILIFLRLLGVVGLGGQTTVLLVIMFVSGIQLFCIGILGTYLGRVNVEVRDRPSYIVSE
jgi:glycosyltransferase involved in cell wall biosynthesis